jgi:tripartite-type tricarboxylate transporter receptor subunit TctC
VPAATPPAIVDRLQAEVSKILRSRTVTDKLAQLGADTDGGPAKALAATIESETARWAEVIRKQNIPLQ